MKKNESVIYYGEYNKQNDSFASFVNVMSSETGEILMNEGESSVFPYSLLFLR